MTDPDLSAAGQRMMRLAADLFPLHRSQTGRGLTETLDRLGSEFPIRVTKVASGAEVFDWTVPDEWSIRDAWICEAKFNGSPGYGSPGYGSPGHRVVDYKQSNLSVINGSQAVDAELTFADLKSHLHRIKNPQLHPDWLPYRTCFFRKEWGFCVSEHQYQILASGGPWRVRIDTEHSAGNLQIGECILEPNGSVWEQPHKEQPPVVSPSVASSIQTAASSAADCPGGDQWDSHPTIVFYAHTCHPALANDNLSGIVVAAELIRHLQNRRRRFRYRFVFAAATIGAVAWLAQRSRLELGAIRHGLILSLLGDEQALTYKQTINGDREIDRLMAQVLADLPGKHRIRPFDPTGYDERQFNSPGLRLPFGRLSRSDHGEYEEYHTSADDLKFITGQALSQSLAALIKLVQRVESNLYPINLRPFGEPMLGRHDLFRAIGQRDDRGHFQRAMLWLLQLADGEHDMHEISRRANISADTMFEVAGELIRLGFLKFGDGVLISRQSGISGIKND